MSEQTPDPTVTTPPVDPTLPDPEAPDPEAPAHLDPDVETQAHTGDLDPEAVVDETEQPDVVSDDPEAPDPNAG